MANEYFVNSADLTAVADAIREKGETSAQLVFPSGFVTAIQNIQSGVEVQKKSGTVTTNSSGAATVSNVGFKPDIVSFNLGTSNGFALAVGAMFAEGNSDKVEIAIVPNNSQYILTSLNITRTSSGFSLSSHRLNYDFTTSADSNRALSYTAIKYT